MSVEIGQRISHYKILEKLGEGGMGVVYKAQDTSLNRSVALKFLPSHLTRDDSTRKRFIVEAQAASALDHPHICNIHEINETPDGQLFICMAYYDGKSLGEKIENGPMSFDEVLNIFIQLAQGLKVAHDKKIIHRDIKPGNILITQKGEVKILDFGLAKLAGVDLTKSTSSKGTTAYMCPEHIRGQKVDHRCDIWALGVVLYEMLTGELPFEGDYPEPMMYAIVNEEPKSLSLYLKKIPELLQDIIDKLLKKEPAERYQDISNVLDDLDLLVKEDDAALIKTKPEIVRLLSRKKIYQSDQHEENKIAVIPMAAMIEEEEKDWITEGMADALITKLAQIGGLRVTSRNSAFKYKGSTKSPPEIATELGIQCLIEVSSIKIEDLVKINAKLIDPLKDEYLWAAEYESNLRNILGLQGQIAKEIANQVQIKLTPHEETRLIETREVNPKTYEMYLKGMYHINKRTESGMNKGLEYLHQAVEKDPTEPLAQAGLALGYCIIAHTPKPTSDAHKLSTKAALRALELDDNLAEVHLALAMIKIYFNWDKIGAEQSYRKALELNPSLPVGLLHYSWFNILIENPEAIPKLMQRAIEIDPLSNIYPAEWAWMNYFMGDYDKTISLSLKSLELVPDGPFALFVLGEGYTGKGLYNQAIEVQNKSAELSPYWKWGLAHTYALAGCKAEALKIAAELEKRSDVWDTWCLAAIYSALGDTDKMFYWLENAYEKRHPYIQWMRNTYFNAYNNDPRYKNLVQRLNLPD